MAETKERWRAECDDFGQPGGDHRLQRAVDSTLSETSAEIGG
jgi:hypothetical protein